MKKYVQLTPSVLIFVLAVLFSTADAQQKGKGRGGFGAAGFGGGNTLTAVAANEAVQKELDLTEDVTDKLKSLRDDVTAARQKEFQLANINFQDFQSLSAEERQKHRDKMAAIEIKLNEEFNPKVKAILSEDQYKRVKQIELQGNLAMRGPGALTYSDVAAELKLTDEQKKKLNDSQREIDAKQRELLAGGGGGGQAFAQLREERRVKTMEVLTDEQKEKLKSLQGGPFNVAQLFGGIGGRRGKGN